MRLSRVLDRRFVVDGLLAHKVLEKLSCRFGYREALFDLSLLVLVHRHIVVAYHGGPAPRKLCLSHVLQSVGFRELVACRCSWVVLNRMVPTE